MRKLGISVVTLLIACGGTADDTVAPAIDAGNDATVDGSLQKDSSTDAPPAKDGAGDAHVPPACDGGICPPVFAVRALFLGDTDRSFIQSGTAWKDFGVDIDGKSTTSASTDVCQQVAGAAKSVQADGTGGIDNSFGANILPIAQNIGVPTPSQTASNLLETGGSTLVFRMQGLGSAMNYPAPLVADMYKGMQLAAAPLWDGTDLWPISSQSVKSNDVNMPVTSFPNGSVTARFYDSAPLSSTGQLNLTFGTLTLSLPINALRIQGTVASDNSTVTLGMISGVVKTTDMVEAFRQAAGSVSPSLCSGATFDGLAALVTQSSDIMHDGTQDNTKTCDAISIGLGFEATAIGLGPVQNDPLGTPACPDAGM